MFDRSLLRTAVSLSAGTSSLFGGTLFLLVARSLESVSLDSLSLSWVCRRHFVWWCIGGELAWLVWLGTRLIGRARLQVTVIVLILNSLHFQIYSAISRLNFLGFLFELSGSAAQISLVLHSFARFFFISVPMRQQVVHDFLNGIKWSCLCLRRVTGSLLVFDRILGSAKAI